MSTRTIVIMRESPLDTAARLFAAIEAKQPEAVAALYTDDVAVWHNFSNAAQDKATNLATLTALCSSVPEIRYEVQERLLLADGRVLQRHLLRARVASGEEIVIPACMLVTVRDAQICRIDEYLDTGQANRLRAASGRPAI
jgi:ketosteroid isomerase-like protein